MQLSKLSEKTQKFIFFTFLVIDMIFSYLKCFDTWTTWSEVCSIMCKRVDNQLSKEQKLFDFP